MENKATFTWEDWDYEIINRVTNRVTCQHCDWVEEYHAIYYMAGDAGEKLYTVHWEETHGADK